MKEFELIARLVAGLPSNNAVVAGPGDDCAVLDLGIPGQRLLFKTDAVVEGVHFTRETPPALVGRKALARCLSDIAAMAGEPTHAVVTLGLPKGYDPDYVQKLYDGLGDLALQYRVGIVGGETTTTPGGVMLSVAMLGRVKEGREVYRRGAKPGDAVFVTGELEGSLAGHHLEFEPRLAEAQWLADHFKVHAMIDLSDGLAGDLPHLLRASGVGAELMAKALPISRAARLQARTGKPALEAALTDGEDFELLFTVASAVAVRLVDAWKAQFPKLRLSCIGKIMPGAGLVIRDRSGVKELSANGYVHFA